MDRKYLVSPQGDQHGSRQHEKIVLFRKTAIIQELNLASALGLVIRASFVSSVPPAIPASP